MSKMHIVGRRFWHDFSEPTWELIDAYNSKFAGKNAFGVFDVKPDIKESFLVQLLRDALESNKPISPNDRRVYVKFSNEEDI